MTFEECKKSFYEERSKEDGQKVMERLVALINKIGSSFLELDGGELMEIRSKIVGYKFHLSDYLFDLERISESIKIEIKEDKARCWDAVAEEIKARDGKVKNKEQIDNAILLRTADRQYEQILYQTMYHKYKMKISAVDDVITAITQRVAALKKQIEDAKY